MIDPSPVSAPSFRCVTGTDVFAYGTKEVVDAGMRRHDA